MNAALSWQDYVLAAIASHRLAWYYVKDGQTSNAKIERNTADRAIERAVQSARHVIMRERCSFVGDPSGIAYAIACEQRLSIAFRCAMLDGNIAVAKQAVRECAA